MLTAFREQRYKHEVGIQMMLRDIPDHMHDSVWRWVNDGVLPGDFMQAILHNDFPEAILRADEHNKTYLFGWAFILHHLPRDCWGSEENYKKWHETGGYNGLEAQLLQASLSQTDA
jgi:hypothetical protein